MGKLARAAIKDIGILKNLAVLLAEGAGQRQINPEIRERLYLRRQVDIAAKLLQQLRQ